MANFLKVDWWVFIPSLLLVSLGSLVLSSVSSSSFPQYFFFLGAALILFLFFTQLDVRILRNFSGLLYVGCIILLLATLLFGQTIRGATRWLSFGPVSFQTSEIIKPFLFVFFASLMDYSMSWRRLLLLIIFILLPFTLIFLQPDLGSGLVIFAGFLGVIFMYGFPLRLFISLLVFLIILAPLGWNFLAEYQRARIETFFTPASDPLGAGYNSLQSMIAVGSGGLFGQGLGQGGQSQLAFLPERNTDFIFAALSEELGFVGSASVIIIFSLLLARIIIVLKNVKDIFLQSLLGGIFVLLFIQIFVNIGMNLGFLPITGVPLPLISAGGSSLMTTSIMLGIVSSISVSLQLQH